MRKAILILVVAYFFVGCGQEPEAKKVVFVCTHGAARSPIAAAYFNKIIAEKELNYTAVFRGTVPDSVLTKETARGLTNDEFLIKEWKPKKVSNEDFEGAFRVVTFDLDLYLDRDNIELEQWNGTPPISKDYNKARNIILEKVENLIEDLPK